jgi:hypothetical protein
MHINTHNRGRGFYLLVLAVTMRGLGSIHSCRPFGHVGITVFFSASHTGALARRARNCNTKHGGGGFEMAAFSAGADEMAWIGHRKLWGKGRYEKQYLSSRKRRRLKGLSRRESLGGAWRSEGHVTTNSVHLYAPLRVAKHRPCRAIACAEEPRGATFG